MNSLKESGLLIKGVSETIKNEAKEQEGAFLAVFLGTLSASFKFNGVYSRNNLSKIKDEAYIINLDEFESVETHWIVLYVNDDNVTYFDSFGVEHIPKEIRTFIGNKNIITYL